MHTLSSCKERWNVVLSFHNEGQLAPLLRQTTENSDGQSHPVEDGLRSVCWKILLLLHPYEQAQWAHKLSEWRSTYSTLASHFLAQINQPEELDTVIDPLADDENSPWNTVRKDEASREEILRDVKRCMQDVPFFQEPSTQRVLLDILFIYSKLHPDIGYRQGMHEILAPILWTVHGDSLETAGQDPGPEDYAVSNMLEKQYITHDTFTLFCAIMQTLKGFYEFEGSGPDSRSTVMERSQQLHDVHLLHVDPELAEHFHTIGMVPQIFLLRWMRLLFLREFDMHDVLKMWDALFSHQLKSSLVDMTCLAMLLRIRWQLLQADVTEALKLALHFELPSSNHSPVTLVQDAVCLEDDRTRKNGAGLIAHYSGRQPSDYPQQHCTLRRRPAELDLQPVKDSQARQQSLSARSPRSVTGQFASPPNRRNSLLQEVSGTLQRKSEGWKLPKSVRNAVVEVRRNVNTLQSGLVSPRHGVERRRRLSASHDELHARKDDLNERLTALERRNQNLATALQDVVNDLETYKPCMSSDEIQIPTTSFYSALNKLQSLQSSLANNDSSTFVTVFDSSPSEQSHPVSAKVSEAPVISASPPRVSEVANESPSLRDNNPPAQVAESIDGHESINGALTDVVSSANSQSTLVDLSTVIEARQTESTPTNTPSPVTRAPLERSPFSYMLGGGHHRSEFVSSSAPPPEQNREGFEKRRSKQLFSDGKENEKKPKQTNEDDGFILSALKGNGSGGGGGI